MKFSIEDFISKCGQIHGILQIWSHLLKKLLMENFMYCVVAPVVKLAQIWQPCFIYLSLWNQKNFHPSFFMTRLDIMFRLYIVTNSHETRCLQNNISGGLHSYCNSNFKIFKGKLEIKIVYTDAYSTVKIFLHYGVAASGWCFDIFFWMIWVLGTSLLNFYKTKTAWLFGVRSHVTQHWRYASILIYPLWWFKNTF